MRPPCAPPIFGIGHVLFRSGRNPNDETQARLSARGIDITRVQAKTVNFSICYGGTAWSLKDNLGLGFGGLQTAQQILGEMKAIYPDLFDYLDGVKTDLENSPEGKRYVRSIRGRRRAFNHPGELTPREMRQAANAVVQMLEVDVFKKTVLELDAAFKREGLPSRWYYYCCMTGYGLRVRTRSRRKQRS